MGPLRLILIILLAVVFTGFTFLIRATLAKVMDIWAQSLGYPYFSWDLVPDPIRTVLRAMDEYILPHTFIVLLIAGVILELISWWRATHEGRIVLYGGG